MFTARRFVLSPAGGLALLTAAALPLVGVAASIQHPSAVATTSQVLASDRFDSPNRTGWGTAPIGGNWKSTPGQAWASSNGKGRLQRVRGGAVTEVSLPSVTAADLSVRADVIAPRGLNFGFSTQARVSSRGHYRSSAEVGPTGVVTVKIIRSVHGVDTVLATQRIAQRAQTAQPLTVELSMKDDGASTILSARAFTGATPPTWQTRATDGSSSRPISGAVGLRVANAAPDPREFAVDNVQATENSPVQTPPVGNPPPTDATAVVSTPHLAFDLPQARSSSKRVFAMYFPPYPVSIDNSDPKADYYSWGYLSPTGEWNKHVAYGGLLRDRPALQAPLQDENWKLRNLEGEIRAAKSAGIDGFTLNMLTLGEDPSERLWETSALLAKAAENVGGFSITVMPDLTAYPTVTVAELAKATAALGRSTAAYKLDDGRLIVTPFYAEGKDVTFWRDFSSTMKTQYGLEVALIPIFVNDPTPLIPRYAPVSYGASIWGVRNPAWNDPKNRGPGTSLALANLARSNGLKWMQPVSVQDERPNQGIYDEAENTGNLRATWQLAQATGADIVHIPTWNDYSEGTQLGPSQYHGRVFLDINAFYASLYKSGAAPSITRDAVYVTHRRHPAAAIPTFPQTVLMRNRGGSEPRDTVEALSMLTQAGRVQISVGGHTTTCDAPAGVSICTAPLAPGSVSAEIQRGGQVIVRALSPVTVVNRPTVQDLQYVAVGEVAR